MRYKTTIILALRSGNNLHFYFRKHQAPHLLCNWEWNMHRLFLHSIKIHCKGVYWRFFTVAPFVFPLPPKVRWSFNHLPFYMNQDIVYLWNQLYFWDYMPACAALVRKKKNCAAFSMGSAATKDADVWFLGWWHHNYSCFLPLLLGANQ